MAVIIAGTEPLVASRMGIAGVGFPERPEWVQTISRSGEDPVALIQSAGLLLVGKNWDSGVGSGWVTVAARETAAVVLCDLGCSVIPTSTRFPNSSYCQRLDLFACSLALAVGKRGGLSSARVLPLLLLRQAR